MLLNKRGAALLQVLIVAAILAGMSAMILRLSLSRTITSRQTRHTMMAQSVIESCMAEVNAIWATKTPVAYARDLAACQMCDSSTDSGYGCESGNDANGFPKKQKHTCYVEISKQHNITYTVEAKMESVAGASQPCKITYTILNSRDTL